MIELVPSDEIEKIVGFPRLRYEHVLRLDSEQQRVYILHSAECVKSTPDLRDCLFSQTLEAGVDEVDWMLHMDRPVLASTADFFNFGRLVPDADLTLSETEEP